MYLYSNTLTLWEVSYWKEEYQRENSFILSYVFKEKLLKSCDSEKLSWLLSAEGERLIKSLFWKVDHENN